MYDLYKRVSVSSVFLLKYFLWLIIIIATFLVFGFLYAYPGIIFLFDLPEWFNPVERFGYFCFILTLFFIYVATYLFYQKKKSFRYLLFLSIIFSFFGFLFFDDDISLMVSIGYFLFASIILILLASSRSVSNYLHHT